MKRKSALLIAAIGIVLFCSSCSSVRISKDCGCGSFNEKAPVEQIAE